MATQPASASSSPGTFSGTVRNVVLVHGAYADGSSWSEVIERLQGAGLTATAVQNPLTSLAPAASTQHAVVVRLIMMELAVQSSAAMAV
jgi:hypothetical protein